MRVYGSSPLFNYVELVFRSKRLFIISIILASIATTGFYLFRAKSYNARMLVILTGSQVVGAQEDTERGTIKFKLDVLNALVRNPNFIKQAMRPLATGKNEFEFAEFCKKVSGALSYSSDGGSLLEITCHWEDQDCAAHCQSVLQRIRPQRSGSGDYPDDHAQTIAVRSGGRVPQQAARSG